MKEIPIEIKNSGSSLIFDGVEYVRIPNMNRGMFDLPIDFNGELISVRHTVTTHGATRTSWGRYDYLNGIIYVAFRETTDYYITRGSCFISKKYYNTLASLMSIIKMGVSIIEIDLGVDDYFETFEELPNTDKQLITELGKINIITSFNHRSIDKLGKIDGLGIQEGPTLVLYLKDMNAKNRVSELLDKFDYPIEDFGG